MAKKANRKMIGGFVVLAVIILAVSIVIFGSGNFFRKKEQFVLFFDDSLKGLNVGAPVLTRGVKAGAVTQISFVSDMDNLSSEVAVFIEIYPDTFDVVNADDGESDPTDAIPQLIKEGLRAQLISQSLVTGQLVIEVSMRPDTPLKMLNLPGYEKFQEIPTIPSTLSRLGKELQKFDLQEINNRLNSILASADTILKNPNIAASLSDLNTLLKDARGLVANVNDKVDPLADNLNRTITSAGTLVDDVDSAVKPLLTKIDNTLDVINKLVKDVDSDVDPVATSATEALEAARDAFISIDSLVGKQSTVRTNLDTALKELAMASRSLRTLADYLEQHPDALIKGKGYQNY